MISVVVPVFNEQAVLPELHRRLRAALAPLGAYEVILVDDGSTDGSAEAITEWCLDDPRWKLLRFSRNFGHQAAVSAGLAHSEGAAVVVIDADLQDPPELIGQMVEKWRAGYDVVYGVRAKRQAPIWKRMAYAGFYRLLRRLAAVEIPFDSGDFCLMDRAVVQAIRACPERTPFLRGLRSWVGFKQIGVAYDRPERVAGTSKYTFAKLFGLAADGLLSFSNLPLRLASALGVGFCGLSISLILAIIAWRLSDVAILGMTPRQATGWTSLCSLILMLAGLQFLTLGIMGEYLARMVDEVKGRPPWIVAGSFGFDDDQDGATGYRWETAERGNSNQAGRPRRGPGYRRGPF